MGRTGRKYFRRDQLFARPEAGEWIQTIRQRFAKNDNVRFDVKVFHSPKLSGTIKTHLNLVIDEQNIALVEDLLECWKIFARRNYIAAGCLDRPSVERCEL